MQGAISCGEFERQAKCLAEASKGSSQEWTWIPNPVPGCSCRGWLTLRRWLVSRKRVVKEGRVMCDEVDELEDMQVDGVSAREDVSALSPRDLSKQGDAWFEYHAVHSATYNVPVLYLRGQDIASGSLLKPELVWELCCSADARSKGELSDVPLPTPEEHPATGEPFLFIHPCRTQEVMRQMGFTTEGGEKIRGCAPGMNGCGYLLMWISIYGAAVGLRLDDSIRMERRVQTAHT